ncbi:transposase [Candidatus Thioglobus autotrophicus]|uniref:transposase n=1 Tax=Candidatus Thioglobus autotrophicus TaxID=1705394 RepID=UPI00299E47E3|nr:transposase [Candidatus Thioglobus autotrophicus]WPE17544.1 transposase [Candidatus Thioglobus autotrophicus]
MSIRNIEFVNGEYYHVFNRGVDKRSIFSNKSQQAFFFNRLQLLNTTDNTKYFNNQRNKHKDKDINGIGEQLVSIVAYSLLPNHYHLLLKQEVDNGISQFMQRLGTSYTMFFNQEEKRSGGLFQGKFKATHLSGEYALPTVSAYVNLNHKHHGIDPNNNLVKSSIFEYLDQEMGTSICSPTEIQNIITESGGLTDYKAYIKQASIAFADNKGRSLNVDDFEF